ncbi:MAG: glycosyltransferase family 2 protein [Acidobacteriia bacterium]|nr:glycosyltransferase family 2 protein [Terriglobia bacterium]
MTAERAGRPHLTVVIPAYNEERRIAGTLARIAAYVEKAGLTEEILVVDDGSSDATAGIASDVLRGRRGRVLRSDENRGKGHAVRRGVVEAAGRWVLLTDADLSAPIEEHATLADAVRERDLDVAIGSRALSGSRVEVRQSAVRQAMGRTFNRIIRLMTGLPYRDTQCGFKLLDRDRVRPLFEKMVVDRFAFDVEFLYLCKRFGLKVREVPVVWRNSPGSKVSLLGDPINMIFDVARVRWRFRRGLYNPEVPAEGRGGGGGEA